MSGDLPVARAALLDFAALVASEQAALLRLARRLVRDPEEARDLVQATLADAYERRGDLRDGEAATAWLRSILVRRALSLLRRRRAWRQVRAVFGLDPRDEAVAPVPDQALARSARMEAVARSLPALPARQAAAFTLRYLEGLEVEEVARAMGVGKGTAKTHLHRALVALRGALGPAEKDEEAR